MSFFGWRSSASLLICVDDVYKLASPPIVKKCFRCRVFQYLSKAMCSGSSVTVGTGAYNSEKSFRISSCSSRRSLHLIPMPTYRHLVLEKFWMWECSP